MGHHTRCLLNEQHYWVLEKWGPFMDLGKAIWSNTALQEVAFGSKLEFESCIVKNGDLL